MATAIEEFANTSKRERLLRQERFIVEVTERIIKMMKEQGVTRTELAERLGKSKGRVSQLLDGESNLTLRTVSDIFAALGHKVVVDVERQTISKAIHIIPFERELSRNPWHSSPGWAKERLPFEERDIVGTSQLVG